MSYQSLAVGCSSIKLQVFIGLGEGKMGAYLYRSVTETGYRYRSQRAVLVDNNVFITHDHFTRLYSELSLHVITIL